MAWLGVEYWELGTRDGWRQMQNAAENASLQRHVIMSGTGVSLSPLSSQILH